MVAIQIGNELCLSNCCRYMLHEKYALHQLTVLARVGKAPILSQYRLANLISSRLTKPCTMPGYFMQISYIHRVHSYLFVTCHLYFGQNGKDLLRATAVQGWNGYRNKSAQKVDPGEENSPAAPVGTRTRDLLITSPAL